MSDERMDTSGSDTDDLSQVSTPQTNSKSNKNQTPRVKTRPNVIIDDAASVTSRVSTESSIFPGAGSSQRQMTNREYFLSLVDLTQDWENKSQRETEKLMEKFPKHWANNGMRDPQNTYEFTLNLTHIRNVGKLLLHQTSHSTTQSFDISNYVQALKGLGINDEDEYSCDLAAEKFNQAAWQIRRRLNKLSIMPTFPSTLIDELKAKRAAVDEARANRPKAVRTKKVFDEKKVKNYSEMTLISKKDQGDLEEKSATAITQKVFKILKTHLKEKKLKEINLVEFALEDTFEKTLNNLFYLFFLTKDGYMNVHFNNPEPGKEPIENVSIKPVDQLKPGPISSKKNDKEERFSRIMQFDTKTWKKLYESRGGEANANLGIIGQHNVY